MVNFFEMTEVPQGTGSGFVWDQQGHVVTNFHVPRRGNLSSRFSDQSNWKATVVGASRTRTSRCSDRLPRGKLPPLLVGTSTGLQVGQKVFAIGNPFGLDETLTTGVVERARTARSSR